MKNFFNDLEDKLKPYLLNVRNIDLNDYLNIEFIINHPKSLKSLMNDIPEVIKVNDSYQISKFDKLYLMIETIFNENYYFNEGMYTADILVLKNI